MEILCRNEACFHEAHFIPSAVLVKKTAPGVPLYGGRHRQKWHGMEALPCISDKFAYFSQFFEGDIAFEYASCYNQTIKNLCSPQRKTLLVCVQIIGPA